ncbi:MAG: D-alanine-D-alanine ligase, partial [Kiritimatiellia bacterium]
MKNKMIGVLMGGLSTERDISMTSGAAVSAALRARGYRVVDIDVGRDLPAKLVQAGVQVAWLALHGRFGEDGCVQGLLEVMGIPYTGSDVLSSSVAMDKAATKRVVAGLQDVVLAADIEIRRGEALPDVLPNGGVVKPVVGGSTIGIRVEQTEAGVRDAVAAALMLDPVVIVEEYVAGDEITVAVLDGQALPVVRILPESGFFDFEAK